MAVETLAAAAAGLVDAFSWAYILQFGYVFCCFAGMMLSGTFCKLWATEPECLSLSEADRPSEKATAPLPSEPTKLVAPASRAPAVSLDPASSVSPAPAPAPDTKATPKRAEPPKAPPRLWRLDDKFYDLTEFVKHHPGGELPLTQGMGTDITAMFHSHHMRGVPASLLAKYEVKDPKPEDVAYIEPNEYSFEENGFFETCKRRVQAMGLTHGVQEVDNKYVAMVTCVFCSFLFSWYATCYMPLGAPCLALAFLNMWTRMSLTGIGHEAIHGRMRNWLTWEFFDIVMLFPSESWHLEHVTQHHPHTKRHEKDPDEILDPFRLCEHVPWTPVHIFQAPLQAVLVFASLISCIDKHVVCRVQPLKGLLYLFVFHMAPFFTRATWGEAWLLAMMSAGAANLTIVLCFHLSHINESNALHARFQEGGDWGAHQLLTSTNFNGTIGGLLYITGMLEMQIEHHLFPVLSYDNQLKIRPVVKQCAKDFGLPYYEYASAYHGIAGHLYHMHQLGWADTATDGPPVHVGPKDANAQPRAMAPAPAAEALDAFAFAPAPAASLAAKKVL